MRFKVIKNKIIKKIEADIRQKKMLKNNLYEL